MNEEIILLTPTQVASAIGCLPQYLIQHEEDFGLKSIMTAGGHRRYALHEVQCLVDRFAVVKQADVALAKLLIWQRKK